MKRTLCAGAIAFAAIGMWANVTAARAGELGGPGIEQGTEQIGRSIDIGRIRRVLQLTPQQERYWTPVEAALRDLARQQESGEPASLVRRIGRRAVSIVLNTAAIERLAAAARPLIAVLSDDQKRAASGMAQQMGLGPVLLAALN
jgi:hypothetical protein